ncbi:hypothetical protein GE09DRAFT_719133 [Coniochaeta sp. 2T2.1]|nr:hypothetical protein GE09DRAFT_719133 [Coniochaeta sp. 2T2.1]
MVYCGKPSKGCSNCRERKIRCDQRDPGCGQCEKRQQECPGYRNIVDLMFRDESSHVIKKAKAKARRKAFLAADPDSPSETEGSRLSVTPEPKGRTLSLLTPGSRASKSPSVSHLNWTRDDTSLLPSPDSGSWPSTPMIAMLYNLNPTSQERGTAFFFSRYVAVDKNCSHQRFDFIYDVWKPVSLVPERQVDGVLASMSAVGLVGLANMTRSPEAADAARKAYGTALRLTNRALQDPMESVKDTTMLAILILSLFEMMTETTAETIEAWQHHIAGATSLAGKRGVEQFDTPGGRKMFLMLCQKVMISCIQRQIPMPRALIDLRAELGRTLDKTDDPTWQMMEPIYELLQARYDIKQGTVNDPEAIITRLLAIEDEFEIILSRFPKDWNYRTIQVSKRHPAIYRDICHVYPSTFLASIWNGVRTCRILVLETVLCQLHTLPEPPTPCHKATYQTCRTKLTQMIGAITASVPQHIGLVTPRTNSSLATPISSVTIRETPSPATSPPTISSRASVSSSTSGSSPASTTNSNPPAAKSPTSLRTGPTLLNPLLTHSQGEEARRFMLLASSTNPVVWPLYVAGASSCCPGDMRAYVVERLRAVCAETGDRGADRVAGMVEGLFEEREARGG